MPDLRSGSGAVLHEARADIGGFKKFLLRGNVVDLAVGVVIGAAFGNVVQAIVKDILNPIISTFGGVTDVSALSVTLGRITFPIGDLISVRLKSGSEYWTKLALERAGEVGATPATRDALRAASQSAPTQPLRHRAKAMLKTADAPPSTRDQG